MSRFIRTSLSMATIGLASLQGTVSADDNFIVQPKLQQTVPTQSAISSPAVGPANPQAALVVQPSRTPPTTLPTGQTYLPQSSLPAQPSPIPTSTSSQPAYGTSFGPTSQPDSAYTENSIIGSSIPSETWRDSNGLTWVKRGSIDANKASEGNRFRVENPATVGDRSGRPAGHSTDSTQSTQGKVASRGGLVEHNNSPTNIVHGQATASAFSLAKASTQSAPVWLDSNPANSTAAQTVIVDAKDDSSRSNRAQKLHLASKVSKQILGDQNGPTKQLVLNGSSLAGPAAVEQQLNAQMARSEQLCRRGMFLSAREESLSAMIQLSRYLDSLSNTLHSEPCIRAARTAMREAEDFTELLSLSGLQELAGSHETSVLDGVDLSRVPPASLAQLYYQHAESKLLEASQQHPWFSDIYYSIGRTYQAEADSRAEIGATPLRLQAVVYYRAATTIRPKNALAANQLGFVLLQMDRPREAQLALVSSVDSKMDIPALQNLAEASRRLGDQRMQQWAISMASTLQRQQPPQAQRQAPEVLELDNRSFGATTPIIPIGAGSPSKTASAPGPTIR